MKYIKEMVNSKGKVINVESFCLYDISKEEFEKELNDPKLTDLFLIQNPRVYYAEKTTVGKNNKFDYELDKYNYYRISKSINKIWGETYWARVEK